MIARGSVSPRIPTHTPSVHDAHPIHSMRLLNVLAAKRDAERALEIPPDDSPAPARVRIHTLGSFEVYVHMNSRGYVPKEIEGQASLLLKCLLSSPGYRCEREQLIDTLWPERNLAQGQDSLRHVLAHLRRALEPERCAYDRSQYFAIDRHAVRLLQGDEEHTYASSAVWHDAHQFEMLANAALKELAFASQVSHNIETVLSFGHKALALYRGAFLAADVYTDWIRLARARYLRLWTSLLRHLADVASKRHQFEQAILLLGQLVDALPDDEDAASRLMLVQGAAGHRGEACKTYEHLCTHLGATLGMPPAREVQVLAQTIFSSESQYDLIKLLN